MKLLTTNTKIEKSNASGVYESVIMQLAPSITSGHNTCPMAKANGCAEGCIFYSGYGKFKNVQEGRIKKTKFLFEHRNEFIKQLHNELVNLKKRADKKNKIPVCRLNGFSDLSWHDVIKQHPDIQFYDYTKVRKHWERARDIKNYHVVFSHGNAPTSLKNSIEILKDGGNVAVVFKNKLPAKWNGYRVLNGDIDDLRFNDPAGYVVGLKEKTKTKISI